MNWYAHINGRSLYVLGIYQSLSAELLQFGHLNLLQSFALQLLEQACLTFSISRVKSHVSD